MIEQPGFPQDRGQGRSMVISTSGIVASESPLASQAGARILERGGDAVDAAIAAKRHDVCGCSDVERHRWRCCFAVFYEAKTGKIYGLNASGWAPAGQSMSGCMRKGCARFRRWGLSRPPYRVPWMAGRSCWIALVQRS